MRIKRPRERAPAIRRRGGEGAEAVEREGWMCVRGEEGRGWQIAPTEVLTWSRGNFEKNPSSTLVAVTPLWKYGAPSDPVPRAFSKPTLSCVREQLERVLRTRHYELWDTQTDFHGFSRREGRGGGRDIVSAACCVAAERRFQVTGSGARFYAACGAGNCGENAFPLLL